MDTKESIVYEDAGLRLKDVIALVKLSAVRILIFGLIAVVLATIIVFSVSWAQSANHSATAEAQIEFTYKGIDQGLSPIGTGFEKDTIRNVNVIECAIVGAGLSEKIADSGYSAGDIRNMISISGVKSDEYVRLSADAADGNVEAIEQLRNYVFYPTKFNVRFAYSYNNLPLTAAESERLVDNIIIEYKNYFRITYGATQAFSADAEIFDVAKAQDADLIDEYTSIKAEYDRINDFLEALSVENPTFRASNGKTFQGILMDSSRVHTRYLALEAHIGIGQITRNAALAIQILEYEILKDGRELDFLLEWKDLIDEQVKDLKPNETTAIIDGNVITLPGEMPPIYQSLKEDLRAIGFDIARINSNIRVNTAKLAEITASAGDTDKLNRAEELLADAKKATASYFKTAVFVITEYMDMAYVQNSVKVTLPTIYNTDGVDTIVFLTIYAIAVVAAIAAAMIVTNIKTNKLKRATALQDS